MICPKCGQMLKVRESVIEDNVRYRKRVCPGCKHSIFTEETETTSHYARMVLNNEELQRMARYRKRKKEANNGASRS